MRFKKVTIQNFMSVGDRQEVQLDKQGLVGIIAPNGSGKSTILEAIVWCLWGNTVRDLKADEVINNKAKEDCEVILELDDGPHQYKITRYRAKPDTRKKNDVLVELNGADATQGVMSDTQTLINDILGINFDTFAQSVLLTANTKSFCTLKDSEQKEVLEDILNIDLLRKAQAAAKKAITDCETSLAGLVGRLEPIADHIEAVERDIEVLNTKSGTWEREKELRKERIQGSIEDTKKSINEAARADGLAKELLDQSEELHQETYKLNEKIAEHEQACYDIEENKIKKNVRKLRKKRIEQNTVIDMTKASIARLASLAGTVCETCSQNIDPDTAEEQIESLGELIDDAETTIRNLDALEERLMVAGESEKTPHLDALGPLRDQLNHLKGRAAELDEEAREYAVKAAGLAAFERRLKDLEASVQDEEGATNPYIELIEAGKVEIKDKKVEAKKLKTKIKAVELDLKGLRFWEKGFGNQGLKSYLMDNVVPFLNERAQKYADIMSDGALTIRFSTQTRLKSGGLREKFNVSVVNENGADVYKGNSSGERRRSDVAIGWALADLAATRASKPVRFRGLDEPFENLDDEGIDAVFKLLQHASKEYETIFCITHNAGLKNRFTKELHVTKQAGFSRISQ